MLSPEVTTLTTLIEQLRFACSIALGDLLAHGMPIETSTGKLLLNALEAVAKQHATAPQVYAKPPHNQVFSRAPDGTLYEWKLTNLDPNVLHVVSGSGIRVGIVGHYGTLELFTTFEAAVHEARRRLAVSQAKAHQVYRACVAFRIEAVTIGGLGSGTETELARFEVYADRVTLVPPGQGGLSDAQRAKVHALPMKGLL